MTPARWARVRQLFDAACAGDAELGAEVRSLLDADTGPTPAVLDVSTAALAAAVGPGGAGATDLAAADHTGDGPGTSEAGGAAAGRVIGPYRLVREIGRGGMGTVYLAERADVGKQVALKLLRDGRATPGAVRRLLAERRVLARLEHPNIARLLDAGVTQDGAPWFAMEYVDGAPLVAACDVRTLTVRARLALFAQVCDAVAYAHRNLIVHRDLKPSNVLVTSEGTVKLLDFGIAKLLSDADVAGEGGLAGAPARGDPTSGVWLMTPRYAAPEQRRGGPITTATDVYTLGQLLRELLSGQRPPPYSPAVAELAQQLGAPGATDGVTADVDAVARARGTSPAGLRRALGGDVQAILACATAEDATRRYPDAERLADDVRRHLAELPVHARPRTLRYRAEKLLRRRRAAVAAGAVGACVVVALTAGLARQYAVASQERDRASRERDRARREAATAERVTEFTTGLFVGGDPWQGTGAATTAGELVARAGARVDSLGAEPVVQARLLAVLGRLNRELGRLDVADRQLARAVAAQRGLTGPDRLSLATSLAELGLVRHAADEAFPADTLLRQALAIRRAALGDTAPIVGTTLAALARVAQIRGDYAGAETLFRRALAIERSPGAPPRAGLQTMANLGADLVARGRYVQADSVLREVIGLAHAAYGPRHALIASALAELQAVAERRGDRVAADTLGDAARRMVAAEEGTGTKWYLDLLDASIKSRWARGRVREADSLAALGLRLSGPLRAEGNTAGIGMLHTVARLRAATGDYPAALALARRVEALERRRGPASATYYDGGATLVQVYAQGGRVAAADSTLRAIAPGVTAPARDSASHAWYTLWRAVVDDAAGRSAAAEPGLRSALAARRATLPADDFLVAELESRLGLCLMHLGRGAEGRALLHTAYAKLRAVRGAGDPITRAAAHRVAEGAGGV